ncbi:GTPase Era, mitochondrial [Leptidea sinapis]|uniref:GTPase Era, mitochondrial n=1 Tax=Leptidea sinapis TaxID=189913 RepID=UPI00213F39D2|nr:GTPase Era, mitochondrial [Leptidea sinapis]
MPTFLVPITKFRLKTPQLLMQKFCSTLPNHSEKIVGKVVNAAFIGAPNSGKSTLINKILGRKVCATSNKVHTTTRLARAICYENDTQIIFLDTPGVVTVKEQNRYKLPASMKEACKKSLNCADVIGVVHDVSNKFTKDKIHPTVTEMLNMATTIPSFLIINKVDMLKSKKQLLDIITSLTNGVIAGNPVPHSEKPKTRIGEAGYSKFSDVFLVSALTGDGVQDIKNYLIRNSKLRKLQYSPDDWTDCTTESLIEEAVRAKFLDFLSQEIPYQLEIQLEYYHEDEPGEKVMCSVAVACPSERLQRLIAGAGGGRLNQIKSSVQIDLINMLNRHVSIDINLTVKKNSA